MRGSASAVRASMCAGAEGAGVSTHWRLPRPPTARAPYDTVSPTERHLCRHAAHLRGLPNHTENDDHEEGGPRHDRPAAQAMTLAGKSGVRLAGWPPCIRHRSRG